MAGQPEANSARRSLLRRKRRPDHRALLRRTALAASATRNLCYHTNSQARKTNRRDRIVCNLRLTYDFPGIESMCPLRYRVAISGVPTALPLPVAAD